jgi:hypothetical protein
MKPAPIKSDPLDRVFADPQSGRAVVAGIFLAVVWIAVLLSLPALSGFRFKRG